MDVVDGESWSEYFHSLGAGTADLSITDWISLSQLEVDLYGGLIADMDPMHNDPEWPTGREKWGGTIVLGSQVLSMLPEFLHMQGLPVRHPDVDFSVLALPRVRFTAPLNVGHRVRDSGRVMGIESRGESEWIVRTYHTLEREGLDKPFMIAESLTRFSEKS